MYTKTLLGSELVSWLIAEKYCGTREEAAVIGRRMVYAGLIHNVCDAGGFEDKKRLYRFYADEAETGRPVFPSAVSLASWVTTIAVWGSLTFCAAKMCRVAKVHLWAGLCATKGTLCYHSERSTNFASLQQRY